MKGFDDSADKHSDINAYWMARAARLAYESGTVIAKQAHAWGMSSVCMDEPATDTQLFLLHDDAKVIVAFRGTEMQSPLDVLSDLDARKAKSDIGSVHQGFWQALESVWRQIDPLIGQHSAEGQSVWFTGHSLGAALATLAAAKRRQLGHTVQGLYTFGSPRVGDRQFVQWLASQLRGRIYRYVNDKDAVTFLPSFLTGYAHVGELFRFDASGKLAGSTSLSQTLLSVALEFLQRGKQAGIEAVADHSMDHYMRLTDARRGASVLQPASVATVHKKSAA